MFEIFNRTRERFILKSFVSVNPQGIFRFNMKCVRKYIQNKLYVDIFVDKELHRIGFQFVNTAGICSMKLCKAKESLYLFGKCILDKLDIQITKTKQFDLNEDGNIIYMTWQ